MKFHKFEQIKQYDLVNIDGTDRYLFNEPSGNGYRIPDIVDLDLMADGPIHGHKLTFYDTKTGQVEQPIPEQDNVFYTDDMIYLKSQIFFIQVDFNKSLIHLFSYQFENKPKVIFTRSIDQIDLDTLQMIPGDDSVFIYSEKVKDEGQITDIFWYPHEMKITENQSLEYICCEHQQHIYYDHLIEYEDKHGDWIDKHEVIIKDFEDHLIRKEKGYLQQLENGQWWIA